MTRQDKICIGLCSMSAVGNTLTKFIPSPWFTYPFYAAWIAGMLWLLWKIHKGGRLYPTCTWKQHREMKRLGYKYHGASRSYHGLRFWTIDEGDDIRDISYIADNEGGWVATAWRYVGTDGINWTSPVAYDSPVTAHVTAVLENWGGHASYS